ncbi:hypothetical protein N8Y82_03150 [Gammaproteobacteria bacterium]|nr:hypothetical protein [Gammaproteobacteria bacterium]
MRKTNNNPSYTFTKRGIYYFSRLVLFAIITQTILALGIQDIDPDGLQADIGITVCGASSDHLILEATGHYLPVGAEVHFQLNYSALLRAMTSPFIRKNMT